MFMTRIGYSRPRGNKLGFALNEGEQAFVRLRLALILKFLSDKINFEFILPQFLSVSIYYYSLKLQ